MVAEALSILDVGQGTCVLMASAGQSAVVDCPPGHGAVACAYLNTELENPDPPIIIASHRDVDHIGGLAAIIRERGASLVVINRSYGLPMDPRHKAKVKAVLRELFDLIEELELPQAELSRGQELDVGDFSLKCLWPSEHAINLGTIGWEPNKTSLVLKVTRQGGKFLLTGDLVDTKVWDYLVAQNDLDVDVLMLPHHGGAFGRVQEVLNASAPTHCVFSYGRRNSYGHPDEPTLAATTSRLGTRVMCTQVTKLCHAGQLDNPACAGTVRFDATKGGIEVRPSPASHQVVIDRLSSPKSALKSAGAPSRKPPH